ncbi:MAG TPA: hypothetical protein VHG28_17995 [Longimicrobiaceae bacterium]|nr:hypothetical protein [Longimicrobiaceae bacterium]
MAKFSSRVTRLLVAGILITIGGCSESNPTIAPDNREVRYEPIEVRANVQGTGSGIVDEAKNDKLIGPEGGTLVIPGGHSLTFPAGALSAPTRIEAKVNPRYIEVEFSPHGLQFPAGHEPTLTLSAQGANVAPFQTLNVVYLERGRVSEVLPTEFDVVSKNATAKLQHFSGYALAGGRSVAN